MSHCSLLLIILSIIFPTQESKEIGRYDAGEVGSLPDLGIGIILEIFQSSGIAAVLNEELNSLSNISL